MGVFEGRLDELLKDRLNRDNLGIPKDVLDQQKNQLQTNLDRQLSNNVQNRFNNLNTRGVLDSSITSESLNQANKNYANALTEGTNKLNWQNEQMKSNQLQNALSQAMNWDQNQWQRGFQENQFDWNKDFKNRQQDYNELQGNRQYELEKDKLNFQEDEANRRYNQWQKEFDFNKGKFNWQKSYQEQQQDFREEQFDWNKNFKEDQFDWSKEKWQDQLAQQQQQRQSQTSAGIGEFLTSLITAPMTGGGSLLGWGAKKLFGG